ncbi:hypothetical protein L596_005277 [Steinernema carpocapsae]|uniref:Uncharacterized protein n=1 Tax=Steinernema carpocapsae TaxID=34508 RepID=A0A4U8V247_STECR|nr:hypothetical protein L596_005277 [Steinernema carpocapsae]
MISSIFAYIVHLLTVTYFFFYYLVKGKQEWKERDENPCERKPPSCCLHNNLRKSDNEASEEREKTSSDKQSYSSKTKPWWDYVKSLPRRTWDWIRNHTPPVRRYGGKAWEGTKSAPRSVWSGVKAASKKAWNGVTWLLAKPAGSKSIDETTTFPAAATFRQTDQSEIYDEQFEERRPSVIENSCPKPFVKQLSAEEDLINFEPQEDRVFSHHELLLERSATVPSSPPPPPQRATPKGGIAVLPPNLILNASSRPHADPQFSPPPPPIPETPKTTFPQERATSVLSFRSQQESVPEAGSHANNQWSSTTTKRDIVSRIPRPNGEDAQFIFRSYRPKQFVDSESSFMMGRSVYKPLEEAERMRTGINRRSESRSSRMNTPFEPIDASRISTPNFYRRDYDEMPSAIPTPIHMGSARLRSRTVEPSSTMPSVRDMTDRWPPRSNATGPLPVKDNFLDFAEETTVTSCKRKWLRLGTFVWDWLQ